MDDETKTGKVDDVMEQARMGAAADPAGEKRSADTASTQSPDNAQARPPEDAPKPMTADERIEANEKFDDLGDDAKKRHVLYERMKDAVGRIHEEMDKIGGTFGVKARALLDEALVEMQKSL